MKRSLAFVLLAGSGLARAAFAAPVALLTDVRGSVVVERRAFGPKRVTIPARTGLRLEAGDRIVSKGGTATLFSLGGAPRKIGVNAQLSVAAPSPVGAKTSVWRSVYAGVSSGLTRTGTRVTATVRAPEVELVSPVRGFVLDARPTFRWKADALSRGDFADFQLVLTRADGAKGAVWTQMTTRSELIFPRTSPALAPGQYEWLITPRTANAQLVSSQGLRARFSVPTPVQLTQLKSQLAQVEGESKSSGWKPLARAVILRRNGFLHAALNELNDQKDEASALFRRDVQLELGQDAPDLPFLAAPMVIPVGADGDALGWAFPDFDSLPPSSSLKVVGDAKGRFSLRVPAKWGHLSQSDASGASGDKWAASPDSSLLICVASAPDNAAGRAWIETWSRDAKRQTALSASQKNGRLWVTLVAAPQRNSSEFRAGQALVRGLRFEHGAPATSISAESLKAEIEATFKKRDDLNHARDARFRGDTGFQSPGSSARAASIEAGRRAWTEFGQNHFEQAALAWKQSASEQKQAYEWELAAHENALAQSQTRINTLRNRTVALALAPLHALLLDNELELQASFLDDEIALARDANNAKTQRQAARALFEWRRKQLELTLLSSPTLSQKWEVQKNVLSAISKMGDAARVSGQYAIARAYYERSLEGRHALPAAFEGRQLDLALRDLGTLEAELGDQNAARHWYQQSLSTLDESEAARVRVIESQSKPELREMMRAERAQTRALVWNNLAILTQNAGDYAGAHTMFGHALEAVESLPQSGFAGRLRALMRATTLGNIAVLKGDSGDNAGALKENAEVAALWRSLDNPEGASLALLNRAGLLEETGDSEGARLSAQTAGEVFETLGQTSRVAATFNFRSRLARQGGDFDSAASLSERALELSRSQNDLDLSAVSARGAVLARLENPGARPDFGHLSALLRVAEDADARSGLALSRISTLDVKAQLQEKSGDEANAIETYRAAIARLEAVRATTLSPSDFAELKSNYKIYDRLVRLLVKANRGEEAFDTLGRARSKKLVDELRLSLLQSRDPQIQTLLDRYAALETRLRTLKSQLETETARPTSDPARASNLRGLLASTQAQWFSVSAQLRARYPAFSRVVAVSPRELKRAQPLIPVGAALVQYAPLGEDIYAFVVTRESLRIFHLSAKASDLNTKAREFRRQIEAAREEIAGGQTPPSIDEPGPLRTLSTQLYAMLVAPLEESLSGQQTVAIIPTGELFYLPFHALARETASGTRFWIEDKTLAYLAAADVLSVVQPRDEAHLGSGVLALGDPTNARLPSAREEVQSIARLFPASRVLTGGGATKAALFAPQNQNKRILHFAAHAVLNASRPDQSFIQLAPSGRDDGRLRIGEIYGLDLNRTDLVTLSACSTALGERSPDGSEITTLAQSFSSAGAPTVVASLWNVEDQSTGALMEHFYADLADGKPKAEALRQAQIALLKNPKTRHPFFWAPFEVLGDWR